MSPLQFPSFVAAKKLAKEGNLVPLIASMPADLETPVGVYMKLAQGAKASFLLESVEGGERSARYSFIGVNPRAVFTGSEEQYTYREDGRTQKLTGDPYTLIKSIVAHIRPVSTPELPPFAGGAVGVFGYDIVRRRERIPDRHKREGNPPEVWLGWYDTIFAFDHVKHRLIVIANWYAEPPTRASYNRAIQTAMSAVARLNRKLNSKDARIKVGTLRSNYKAGVYSRAVSKAKRYIAAGDIFQVVVSQRFKATFEGDPFQVYRRLRRINPSPYLFYLNCGRFQVAGSSPETLVRVEGRTLTVCPIAGTRPRGKDRATDLALEQELLADPKERAEHLMLVDLARNDAGRVSQFGKVRLPDFFTIERYSHVMHIVSRVEGQLRRSLHALDALAACFPAGTVSGAPKVRAMEIIDELERSSRGLYAGAAGYLDYFGNLDTCIAIRTLVFANGHVQAQAGAGVVADSVPKTEERETRSKASALLEALSNE